MTEANLKKNFLAGIELLNLSLDVEPFFDYLNLLEKWNKVHNLTAVRTKEGMVIRHLLDSLAINPFIQGPRVLDVGTGAGLPGIPLALAFKDLQFCLVDSNGKKISFLHEVKRQLHLSNVTVEQVRIENYHPNLSFDTVVTRAFSEIAPMISLTKHLIKNEGIWLAMKGIHPEKELTDIARVYQVQPYKVPGLDEKRCCVIIKNT